MNAERPNPHAIRLVWLQSLLIGILLGGIGGSCATAGVGSSRETVGPLRVTELVVVDPAGVERARIGGDLPDAVVEGRRVPRGERAAGLLLYDETGQERGGFVTWEPSGNVGIGLDTREGQVALFVAGPDSAVALRLWHRDDAVELRSDGDGSRVTAVAGGRVVFQEPGVAGVGEEACAAYREALASFPRAEVVAACTGRFSPAACSVCLGE